MKVMLSSLNSIKEITFMKQSQLLLYFYHFHVAFPLYAFAFAIHSKSPHSCGRSLIYSVYILYAAVQSSCAHTFKVLYLFVPKTMKT